MVVRNHTFSIGEFYHLYSRGVDKRVIFLDAADEERFVNLLYLCNGDRPVVYKETKKMPLVSFERGAALVAIGAYCLMGNHFHLLVKETQENGTSRFMKKVLTAYSSYFNKKYERSGTLFQGNYRSRHLDTDEYLKYVFSYIHLNPLKVMDPDWRNKRLDAEGARQFLATYASSSYLDYAGEDREKGCVLNRLAFPDYFPNPGEFNKEIVGWIDSYPQLSKDRPWKVGDN